MIPRDEFATLVAGTVIAETFQLVDTDGNLVAELDQTDVPEEARFLRMITSENNALENGILSWDFVEGNPLPDVGVSMFLGFENDQGIVINDGIGFTAYDIELNAPKVHAEFDLSVGDELYVAGDVSTAADSSVSFLPCGTVIEGVWTTAPAGCAFLNGQTLVNAQTVYPLAWAVFPTGWRSGSNLILPNLDGRVLRGTNSTPGGLAGSDTHTLVANNLPEHFHSMAHTHDSGHGTNAGSQSPLAAGNSWAFPGGASNRTTGGSSAPLTGGMGGTAAPVTHTPAHMTIRRAIRLY